VRTVVGQAGHAAARDVDLDALAAEPACRYATFFNGLDILLM
jgi:hypothetical protein